jgi:ferredoxin
MKKPAEKKTNKKTLIFTQEVRAGRTVELKRCEFEGLPSILEIAIAQEVPLNHSCGGMGSCTTCRVFVVAGAEKLGERNEVEAEHARMRGFVHNERLSCQTQAEDGMICQIPPDGDVDGDDE